MKFPFDIHYYHKLVTAIEELYVLVCQSKPKKKGRFMDLLATLAAITAAVKTLQSGAAPTSNFATPDVVAAVGTLATTLGVTPVPVSPAPAAT
jgi:hypothetical protein